MIKNFLVSLALSLTAAFLSFAHADATYKTSTGAVFQQITVSGFGQGWVDPSGRTWSTAQGIFTNQELKPDTNSSVTDTPASEACTKIGGSLPSWNDYYVLCSFIETDGAGFATVQGQKDLNAIFSDMKGQKFWTSSVIEGSTHSFDGYSCTAPYLEDRLAPLRVRCILPSINEKKLTFEGKGSDGKSCTLQLTINGSYLEYIELSGNDIGSGPNGSGNAPLSADQRFPDYGSGYNDHATQSVTNSLIQVSAWHDDPDYANTKDSWGFFVNGNLDSLSITSAEYDYKMTGSVTGEDRISCDKLVQK